MTKANVFKQELDLLKEHGVDISCRCPKPCMRHSDYYRGEALTRLRRSLTPSLDAPKICKHCGQLV